MTGNAVIIDFILTEVTTDCLLVVQRGKQRSAKEKSCRCQTQEGERLFLESLFF